MVGSETMRPLSFSQTAGAAAPGAVWLNESGRIVSLPTILNLDADGYLLLTAPTGQRRDLDWLRRHRAAAGDAVTLTDMTAAWTVLHLVGPDGAQTLSRASRRPDGLELAGNATISVGYAPSRIFAGGIGDLPGWSLLISAEFGEHACEVLIASGADVGLRCAGSYAARSLRLEAGRGAWPSDIDDTARPAEAGLQSRVDSTAEYIGRAALAQGGKVEKRLVRIAAAATPLMLFRQEPILANGRAVGMTTSGGFGYRIGRPVAVGWVHDPRVLDDAAILGAKWEIEVAGERVPVEVRPS